MSQNVDAHTIAEIAVSTIGAHGPDAGIFLLVKTNDEAKKKKLAEYIMELHPEKDNLKLLEYDAPSFSEIIETFKIGSLSRKQPLVLLIDNFERIPSVQQRDFAHLVDGEGATSLPGYALHQKSILIGVIGGNGHVERGTMDRAIFYNLGSV